MEKIKILFIIPNLAGGGSERMVTNLCNNLDRNKFDIVLCLLNAEGEYIANIKDDVQVIDLNVLHVRNSIYKIISMINREKPQLVMSTLTHLNIYLSLFLPFFSRKIKFVARESNVLSLILKDEPFSIRFLSRFYSRFSRIVAQSKDMKDDLCQNFAISSDKIVVINNFVNLEYLDLMLEERIPTSLPKDKVNLIAIGRLYPQKGFDMLLKSFAQLTDKHKYHLSILGVGPMEGMLKELATNLSIQDFVSFVGFVQNPYVYMREADVLISSSRFEGFPNVVIEAICCGLPVIANEYKGGINEILGGKSNFGLIIDINNIFDFEKALHRIPSLERSIIKKEARSLYSVEAIINSYEGFFIESVSSRKKS